MSIIKNQNMKQNKNPNNPKDCPKDWEIWVRFPQKGREEHCGLTRNTAYALAKKGLIISSSIRIGESATRGTRLYWLPSIYNYLQTVAKETAEREVLYSPEEKQEGINYREECEIK